MNQFASEDLNDRIGTLNEFWPSVTILTQERAASLVETFLKQCIRPDVTRRFSTEFSQERKKLARFMIRPREIDLEASLGAVLEVANSSAITVELIWEPLEKPVGCVLQGPDQPVSNVMVFDDNTIALVRTKKTAEFLLFDCTIGSVLWCQRSDRTA